MLISHKWLGKYLPNLYNHSPEDIAAALTNSLADVEQIINIRQNLENIVVAEVVDIQQHPTLQKILITKVDIGNNNIFTILTGAKNIQLNNKVAVCLSGGQVIDPTDRDKVLNIGDREMGGILSQGMICSSRELGISDEHSGVMILENEIKIGTDVAELLRDIVYEVENKSISHRGDCFSHIGIARELAAILNIDFMIPTTTDIPIIDSSEYKFNVNIKVDEKLCPRFTAIVIKDVVIKDSPLWLQGLLSAVGVRPINNIVDVTNYVMFDKGQPMHAYDYNKLSNKELVVRMAKDNETMLAINNETYNLSNDMVVISSGNIIEDIAGVMGGLNSEISSETKTIVIESAIWEMYNIRKTSRSLGLRSEASTRFEKGIAPFNAGNSIKDAIQLINDLANGEPCSELIDIYPNPQEDKEVSLDISLVNRFLGIDLNKTEIINILSNLQFELIDKSNSDDADINQVISQDLTFLVPAYRLDINIQEDLLEEIARLYGFDKIIPNLPKRSIKPTRKSNVFFLQQKVSQILLASGLDEIMTYSFISEDIYNKCMLDINRCIELLNPISPELKFIRNSLLPSLIDKAVGNSKSFDNFGYFETGRKVSLELDDNKIHKQPRSISGLIYDQKSDLIYYKAKGIVENVFNGLNLDITFHNINSFKTYIAFNENILHPLRSAVVCINDVAIGFVGEINPKVQNNFELSGRVGILDIDLEYLINNIHLTKKTTYKKLSLYQSVSRDISFWLDNNVKYADIVDNIISLNDDLIQNISLIDVFTSEEIIDKKSVTISISLQSQSKTLSEQDINITIDKVNKVLQNKVKAQIRGI
jgi:phenylalanyl-tRNA synthetase beta chain